MGSSGEGKSAAPDDPMLSFRPLLGTGPFSRFIFHIYLLGLLKAIWLHIEIKNVSILQSQI